MTGHWWPTGLKQQTCSTDVIGTLMIPKSVYAVNWLLHLKRCLSFCRFNCGLEAETAYTVTIPHMNAQKSLPLLIT